VVVDQVEEQILLGLDMIVERARLQADAGGKPAQAHRFEAMLVNKIEARFANSGECFFSRGACRSAQ
jgi:hypothetical protein